MKVGPVEFAVAGAGVALLAAAVLNRSPLAALGAAVSGGSPATAPPIDSGRSSPTAGGTDIAPTAGFSGGGAPAGMSWYTNPDVPSDPDYSGNRYWLTPGALAALDQWGQALGARIVITGAGRSTADQARGHAENPDRFAAPGKSWHERGLAVDVHLPAMKAKGYDTAKVQAAGRATGWCFAGKSGPMHASYGGCG